MADDPRTPPPRVVRARSLRARGPGARAAAAARALLVPAAVAVLLGALVAEQAGVSALVDAPLEARARGLEPAVPRGSVPTVLAVDEGTVARLGAPPWSPDRWAEISAALTRQGLEGVLLADPWPRLVRPGRHDTLPAAGALVVPRGVWDARPTPDLPEELTWLQPSEASLALTPPGAGLAHAARAPGGTWGVCATGDEACRTAAEGSLLPLRRADVPIVPLHVLLDAPDGFLRPGDAGTLLGLTDPALADRVAVGPEGSLEPWVVATARVAGSARVAVPRPPLPLAARVAWLLALYALVAAAVRLRPGRRWLVAGPTAALAAVVAADLRLGLSLPLMTSCVAAVAPAVGWAASATQDAVDGLRRLALLVVRGASRAGTLRRRLSEPADLLAVLADLTRSHAHDAPFCLLLDDPRRGLVHAGGIGLPATELVAATRRADHPVFEAARASSLGVSTRELLQDGRPVRVLPLRQHDRVVAFWVVAPQLVDRTAEPRRIARLARWVGERLALPVHDLTAGAAAAGASEDVGDEALEALFGAADEERRRWTTCVHALATPVVVADVAGVIDAINPALDDALRTAELPRPRSLRELLHAVGGEARLDERIRRLFVEDRPVSAPWPDGGWLVVRPLSPGSDASPLLGYIGWIEVATVPPPVAQGAQGYDADATMLDLPRLGSR